MQVDFVDRYSRGDSVIHRLDARLKLVSVLAFLGLVIATPDLARLFFAESWASWFFYAVAAWVVAMVYLFSGLPWRYLLLRLLAFLPFFALIALGIPLTHAFERGWLQAGQLLTRSVISLLAMITLVATTPYHALLGSLAWLRVPQVFLSILAFMYRYSFVLTDELDKMRRAKLARTFYPSVWQDVRLMANFIGILFVRAFERAERVYAAMCARGWTGVMPSQDDRR